ncbi:MAG: TPM domain-containing protein [Lachnospiraceae bacterium]
MKKYLKHFAVLFILFAIVLVVFIVALIMKKPNEEKVYTRTNTQCKTEERVFDYADVLTDAEEDALRQMIAEKQDEIGCDIVLVTISDPDYAGDNAMMNYADDFYDDNMFGYDEPWGDGALYLDNFLGIGNSYSWFSTCGRVENRYSSSMIYDLIDDICYNVNRDPFGSYQLYINSLANTMSSNSSLDVEIPTFAIWGVAALITLIYILVCINRNVGRKTTDANTYVAGGHAQFPDRRDVFISKHTTSRKIQTNSGGGGGGGHHISSGGFSHGGGGGRH